MASIFASTKAFKQIEGGYLSDKLSSSDLVDMMGEREIELAHTTILRWVQRYVPKFEKRWSRTLVRWADRGVVMRGTST